MHEFPKLKKYVVGFDLHGPAENYTEHHPFVPFTPQFLHVWRVARELQQENPNFGIRINAGEFDPELIKSSKQHEIGIFCAWKTLQTLQQYDFRIRIGHGLAFPEFFRYTTETVFTLNRDYGIELDKDCGVSGEQLHKSMARVLAHDDLYVEICPISHHYLVAEGLLSRLYADLLVPPHSTNRPERKRR